MTVKLENPAIDIAHSIMVKRLSNLLNSKTISNQQLSQASDWTQIALRLHGGITPTLSVNEANLKEIWSIIRQDESFTRLLIAASSEWVLRLATMGLSTEMVVAQFTECLSFLNMSSIVDREIHERIDDTRAIETALKNNLWFVFIVAFSMSDFEVEHLRVKR